MGRVPPATALLALTAVRTTKTNFQLGSIYALATAALLATQEPFSALAAKRLPPLSFVCLTQAALLLSVPVLIARSRSRHDFSTLLLTPRNLGKLAVLFLIGVAGLLLYNFGLRNAHPIIVAAILNLSPFWAAIVAKVVSGKTIPISSLVFWPCFSVAFVGAMLIAVSQIHDTKGASPSELLDSLLHGSWKYALPIPIFFALSGTLVRRWFRGLDEAGSIAANFVVSAGILIPAALIMGGWPVPSGSEGNFAALLLLVGTLAAGAAGRVVYQMALTATENDNGFVTMFFLFVPGLSSLISFVLSSWISDLHFAADSMFFVGLALVAAPLFVFSMKSRKIE
jgi:drug/metabolite transporter (DMT)-like permease